MLTNQAAARRNLRGEAQSLWMATTPQTMFVPLPGNIETDVAVLGGGIVGITLAYLLKEAGLRVAVIEANRIVGGATGHTTAKITSLHGLVFDFLIRRFGEEQARQYAESNQAAIEKIASLVETLKIECDFARESSYTFAEKDATRREVEAEFSAAQRLGLPVRFLETVPLPVVSRGAVCLDQQARFHPRRYLLALAERFVGPDCAIYEMTRALDVIKGKQCTVITDRGQVTASHVVVATHYPFYDKPGLYFARLFPVQSYAIGVRVREPYPGGMYISAEQRGHSFRVQPADSGPMLIIGGEEHKVGQEPDTIGRYAMLEDYIGRAYTVESYDYRWSTQDGVPVDRVPYIGRLSVNHERIYVAAGFAEWGMTKGTAAAMLLADMIQGRPNAWQDVYDPMRFTPKASAWSFMKENLSTAKHFIGDRLGQGTRARPEELGEEEGMLMEVADKRTAAYKDKAGAIHLHNPACTHMGCLVHWNTAEQTWDCPCHGSRFYPAGEVMEGPAVTALKPVEGD